MFLFIFSYRQSPAFQLGLFLLSWMKVHRSYTDVIVFGERQFCLFYTFTDFDIFPFIIFQQPYCTLFVALSLAGNNKVITIKLTTKWRFRESPYRINYEQNSYLTHLSKTLILLLIKFCYSLVFQPSTPLGFFLPIWLQVCRGVMDDKERLPV